MEWNKLVRDKIPDIITSKGEKAITHIADDAEYEQALYTKLQEESLEFQKDPSAEELADILEVVQAIAALKNISLTEAEQVRLAKAAKRGGFSKRIILDRTE